MEKLFFVVNNDLEEVNKELASGGKIKFICPVNESVSNAGASNCYTACDIVGDVFAYVVIEYPDGS